jgi:uncharacterized protein YcfL
LTFFALASIFGSCSKDEPVILSAVSSLSVQCNDAAVGDTISLTTGQPAKLEFSYAPKDVEIKEQEVTFASSSLVDSETKTLTEGAVCTVTASQTGSTTVTYKVSYWNDSKHKDFSTSELKKVVVISGPEQTYEPVTSLALNADDVTVTDTLFLTVGKSTALSFSLSDGAYMKEVGLEPSDKSIFSASRNEDGSVVAQGIAGGESSLKITVTYITKYQKGWNDETCETGEYTVTYPVRVLLDVVPVTDAYISVDGGRKDSLSVRNDVPLSLSVSYEPSNADVKDVTLSVKDTSIASVSSDDVLSGKVGGSTELTITITYITPYGNEATFTKSVKVNVKEIINFADENVKKICVERWDTDGDGELSEDEAASVTDLGTFENHDELTSFDELQYFTGLTEIPENAFYHCYNITSIKLPETIKKIGYFAFYDCHLNMGKDTFTFPEALEHLSEYSICFMYDINIKTIIFKENIKYIGNTAIFSETYTTIKFEGKTPPTAWNITGMGSNESIRTAENQRNVTILVPSASLNKYNKKFRTGTSENNYIYTNTEPSLEEDCDIQYYDYGKTIESNTSHGYYIFYDKNNNEIAKYEILKFFKINITKTDKFMNPLESYRYFMKDSGKNYISLMGRNPYYTFVGY